MAEKEPAMWRQEECGQAKQDSRLWEHHGQRLKGRKDRGVFQEMKGDVEYTNKGEGQFITKQ